MAVHWHGAKRTNNTWSQGFRFDQGNFLAAMLNIWLLAPLSRGRISNNGVRTHLPTLIALIPAVAPTIPLHIRDIAPDQEFTVRAQKRHATVKPIDIRNATLGSAGERFKQ
jgi:hypothetical protein